MIGIFVLVIVGLVAAVLMLMIAINQRKKGMCCGIHAFLLILFLFILNK